MPLRTFCDGRIFGARAGDGPHVLALHGWGRDHRDWSGVLSGVDAVVLDLPGFGASPPPPEPWGSSEYAAAVEPVLDELVAPIVVVGHSFGGTIALQLAAGAPERIGALVLSGVPLARPRGGSRPRLGFRVVRALHGAGVVGDERMESARQKYGSDDYRRAEGVMRSVLVKAVGEDYQEVLKGIDCPVELVWGVDDTAAPIGGARAAASVLRRANLTELRGDHFACFAQTDELRAAIDRAVAAATGP
jgi:pimeloyl-ACP methyl ester carboxylesterase